MGLKVATLLIAVFGVWKFFDERATSASSEAKARSLGYIERFADAEMIAARSRLLAFWQDYPKFAQFVRENSITEREYQNFVLATYPRRADRSGIDAALFRLQVFFDEVAFCRESEVCEKEILDGFFCTYATGYARIYGPFYSRLAKDIGSDPLDMKLQALAGVCAPS